MKNFIKYFIIAALIFYISFIGSTAGISLYESKREVNMKVADSRNAFISIPYEINLNIDVLKTITNNYELVPSENQEERANYTDNADYIKINNVLYEKVFRNTDQKLMITDVSNNLIITNNLNIELNLNSISFDNPLFSSEYDNSGIMPGSERGISIIINETSLQDTNLIEQDGSKIKAVLEFQWNKGRSDINVDININIKVNEKSEDFIINENDLKEELNIPDKGTVD